MPDRILRKTSPVQVPLLPRLAELAASTRKDLIPIAGAYDFANEEWRKRLQLALETAIATALVGISTSTTTVKGDKGDKGDPGTRGLRGEPGQAGADGESAAFAIDEGHAGAIYAGITPIEEGNASSIYTGIDGIDEGGA
jgi:hypothetical protein